MVIKVFRTAFSQKLELRNQICSEPLEPGMTRNLQTLSRFSKNHPFSRGTLTPIQYTVVGMARGVAMGGAYAGVVRI